MMKVLIIFRVPNTTQNARVCKLVNISADNEMKLEMNKSGRGQAVQNQTTPTTPRARPRRFQAPTRVHSLRSGVKDLRGLESAGARSSRGWC